LLWWAPAILLGAGLIALTFHFRGRGAGAAPVLTASETAELKKLMEDNSP